jgi:hypothetical protein
MKTVEDPLLQKLVSFLNQLGTETIKHSGDKNYLGHLIAVHRDLLRWGSDLDVARAGLFHSIYGTEIFQSFKLPVSQRSELQELIGARAEKIAFLNCYMDRQLMDQRIINQTTNYEVVNRENGETYHLSRGDWDDLIRLHLCDWMEQLERMNWWDYRREAYAAMASYLGGVALQNYDRVLAMEPDREAGLHVDSKAWETT